MFVIITCLLVTYAAHLHSSMEMGNLQFGGKWVSLSTAKDGVILKSMDLSGDADISSYYLAVFYCELHIHNPILFLVFSLNSWISNELQL